MNNEMNTEMNNVTANDNLDRDIMSHIKHEPENNKRLWEESHKPVPRFVIDDDEDGYVTVREVIDSANGEVVLTKEKFSQHDLKMLAVDKTVEWKNKKSRKQTTNTITSFAASFAYSFLMTYGISLLIKGMCKRK